MYLIEPEPLEGLKNSRILNKIMRAAANFAGQVLTSSHESQSANRDITSGGGCNSSEHLRPGDAPSSAAKWNRRSDEWDWIRLMHK